jgi:hypothetical protein
MKSAILGSPTFVTASDLQHKTKRKSRNTRRTRRTS